MNNLFANSISLASEYPASLEPELGIDIAGTLANPLSIMSVTMLKLFVIAVCAAPLAVNATA